MDALEQLNFLGRILDQANPDGSKWGLPQRIFQLNQAEKIIARETETHEAAWPIPLIGGKNIYDLPPFLIKPFLVQYRLGGMIYSIDPANDRYFVNRARVSAGSIPFMYHINERRIEIRNGSTSALQIPATELNAVFGNTNFLTFNPHVVADSFPTDGYALIHSGINDSAREFIQYEGTKIITSVDDLQWLNVRRGECGSFPRMHGGNNIIDYCNMVIRYYRIPPSIRIHNAGTVDVDNTHVVGGATGIEGKVKPGDSLYVGEANIAVLLEAFYKNGVLPSTPYIIQGIIDANTFEIEGVYEGAVANDQPYLIVSKSEYPDEFHEAACYGAAAKLYVGSDSREADKNEALFRAEISSMRRHLTIKHHDGYPKVENYVNMQGGRGRWY